MLKNSHDYTVCREIDPIGLDSEVGGWKLGDQYKELTIERTTAKLAWVPKLTTIVSRKLTPNFYLVTPQSVFDDEADECVG